MFPFIISCNVISKINCLRLNYIYNVLQFTLKMKIWSRITQFLSSVKWPVNNVLQLVSYLPGISFSVVNSAIYHGVNVIVIGQVSLEIINFPGRVAGEPAWIWYLSVHLVIGLAGLQQVDPLQSTIGTWYHLINLIGSGELGSK